jgi:hypothetical protein
MRFLSSLALLGGFACPLACGSSPDTSNGASLDASSGAAGADNTGGGAGGVVGSSGSAGTSAQTGGGAGVSAAGSGGSAAAVDAATTAEASSTAEAGSDSSVNVAGKQVLMIGLSTGQPTPGDTIMMNRLKGRGINVSLIADTAITAAAMMNKDLIILSSSEESFNVLTKVRDIAIPVVCMEDGSMPDMMMASARGHDNGSSAVKIVADVPLSAGLMGTVTIAMNPPMPADLGWGIVGPKAIVAATTVDDPTHAAVYGYATGEDMVGMKAPARRVGYAVREALAAHLTEDGLKIFDATVDWALGAK